MRPDPADLPPAFPTWLRRILAAMAAVQVGFAAALWAMPEGWTRVFGLPIAPARAAGVAAAALMLGLAALAWLAPGSRPLAESFRLIQRARRHPASLALPALLLIPVIVYLPSDWAGHVLLAAQCALAALAFTLAGPQAWQDASPRWLAPAAAILIAVGLGLRVWLMVAGSFGPDEGMTLNAVANMAHGRGLTPEFTDGPGLPAHRPDWGRAMLIYGLWARLFGVALLPQRALGLLLGLLALLPITMTARLWYGRRAALVTAALGAISYLSLLTVAGRNNALPMLAFGVTVLLHVYVSQRERTAPHFFVGLLAGLALETHLLALALIAALGGAYSVQAVGRIRQGEGWLRAAAPLGFYALGLLPGLALYAYAHVLSLPHPELYIAYQLGYSAPAGPGQNILDGLRIAALRYARLWQVTPAECLLVAVSALAAAVRRTRADRHWLALLASNELGYLLFAPTNVVNNDYTGYSLPILIGGAGALVVCGFGRGERPGAPWARLSLAAIALAIIAFSVNGIRDNLATFRQDDAVRRPLAEAIRRTIPPGETLVGPDMLYPYLTEYRYMLTPDPASDSAISPGLVGQPHDAFWQAVLLEAWPRALIESHFFPSASQPDTGTLAGSYIAARRAGHPMDYLWIVPDDGLVTGAPYADPSEAPLQMVAHWPVETIRPGASAALHTLWVTRAPIEADVSATLALVDARGETVAAGAGPLVSGWAGEPTSGWDVYRFHDAALALEPPADLPPGAYTLRIALSPSGPCAPQCAFEVALVEVVSP